MRSFRRGGRAANGLVGGPAKPVGQVGKNPAGRGMALDASMVCSIQAALAASPSYAAELQIRAGSDVLRALNTLVQ